MKTSEAATTFVIEVEGQPVTLRRLPTSGEIALDREFQRRLKASWGPGGFAANAKGMLTFLREQGMIAELRMCMEKLTEMQATNAPPSWEATQEFRRTPAGVAAELFFRRDPTIHADLTERAVVAMVTAANAWEIHEAIMAGLSDDGKSGPATVGVGDGGG